ncbi:hypothetical protein D9M72_304730 [compost metagenome]
MDRVADRIVVSMQVLDADGAHYHFARIDADPDLQRDTLREPHAIGVVPHGLLHAQRGEQGPLRMVLVRDGGAEQRQDAVAHRLGHVALIVMNRLHHQGQDRIDQAAGILGIQVVNQRGRPGHVGEQRCDHLALAVPRAAGFHLRVCGAYPLREVGRRVVDRRAGRSGSDGRLCA